MKNSKIKNSRIFNFAFFNFELLKEVDVWEAL